MDGHGTDRPGRARDHRRWGRKAAALAVAAGSLLALPGLAEPAGAHHRRRVVVTTRCDQVARVVGSTLLQLGPLVIGRVEHFRTVECGLARARFVATPEFVQWAAAYGVQWYATSLVLVPTFSFGRPVYLADGFRGPSFGFGPTDLWSVPVTGIGRSCSSAMASLVLVHNGQALPATNALTSVVCG